MAGAEIIDREDIDPGIARLLERKRDRVARAGTYTPLTEAAVTTMLDTFFAERRPGAAVEGVARLGGGASKEQFVFTLNQPESGPDGGVKYILRMDPIQAVSESSRRREFEALAVYSEVVPAPRAEWLDPDGEHFGQPAAIMDFRPGVTKPVAKNAGPNVTGIGTSFDEELRAKLAPHFLAHLARIQNHDWRSARLPSLDAPDADPYQPARWQLNHWSRVWREDSVRAIPVAALAERWLRANLPACTDPVLVHGDYRTGNFLFDEDTGEITAILDWEFVHLGDHHEDLGWMLQDLYSTWQDGVEYVCGLYPRDEFVAEYQRLSGRHVDPATLRWYEILCAWKTMAIVLATGVKAARDGHNHQDSMLTWLAPVGYRFETELCDMLAEEAKGEGASQGAPATEERTEPESRPSAEETKR